MQTEDKVAAAWLEATLETLYDTFKAGKGVTLTGFGGFYVHPEERRGRSNSILDRNCRRYLGGHRRTEARCSHLVSQRTMGNRVAV